MTRDQAFDLAREIDKKEGWKFFSVEPRPDGRFQVKAIFAGQHGEIFHSREDFLGSPFHSVPLAPIARANGNDIASIVGEKRHGRS